MIKTLKTKQFKITAFVLAVVLTLSCVFWNSTKVHALEIDGANVQTFNLDGSSTSSALTSGSFSLFFNCGTDDDSKFVADCEKWTYTDGKWQFDKTGTDTEQLLWKGGNAEVEWIATYPYRGHQYSHVANDIIGGMEEKVPADQTDKAKWSEFDVLWASGTTTDGSLDINFKHLYTKFSVNLTYGTEVDATQTIESVTVGGTYIVRNFNYASQIWGITLSDITDIKALALETPNYIDANDESKGTYNASFEALILPQTAAPKLTIEMSDGRVFATTLTEQEFKSGYQYNIKLKVGQDKVELGGITAAEWGEPVDGGLLETL